MIELLLNFRTAPHRPQITNATMWRHLNIHKRSLCHWRAIKRRQRKLIRIQQTVLRNWTAATQTWEELLNIHELVFVIVELAIVRPVLWGVTRVYTERLVTVTWMSLKPNKLDNRQHVYIQR